MRPQRLNDGFNLIRGQLVRLAHPSEGYFLLIQHGGENSANPIFGQYGNRQRENSGHGAKMQATKKDHWEGNPEAWKHVVFVVSDWCRNGADPALCF